MLWFFEREQQTLRLETFYDNDASEFVVVVRYPDGRDHTERFSDIEQFRLWLTAFERNLTAQRWMNRTGPVLLPYGWPDKRLT